MWGVIIISHEIRIPSLTKDSMESKWVSLDVRETNWKLGLLGPPKGK